MSHGIACYGMICLWVDKSTVLDSIFGTAPAFGSVPCPARRPIKELMMSIYE